MANSLILGEPATSSQINQRNTTFWSNRQKYLDELMKDEDIVTEAYELVKSDRKRMIPAKHSFDFNAALEQSKQSMERLRKQMARKGGLAKKTDALQKLIIRFAAENPDITARKLLSSLRKQKTLQLRVDNEASLLNGDRGMIRWAGSDGEEHRAPISGLKDRLSRAKRT